MNVTSVAFGVAGVHSTALDLNIGLKHTSEFALKPTTNSPFGIKTAVWSYSRTQLLSVSCRVENREVLYEKAVAGPKCLCLMAVKHPILVLPSGNGGRLGTCPERTAHFPSRTVHIFV